MLTFQDIYEEVQNLTGDSSSSATTKHKLRINDTYKQMLRRFNKRTETTDTTVASQQSYELPQNLNKLSSVKITVSSIDYIPDEVVSEDEWNIVNLQGTSFTSDTQTHYYIKDNNILFYPTPASNGNTITYYYSRKDKDLSQDNYTTGTILTLANGGTAVTGSGTTWTSAMVGRYIKINNDGYWYRITAVGSTTTLTIEKEYQGTAIAAGSEAYTIAEVPLLPEEYQSGLIYRPCMLYFMSKRDQQGMVATYKAMYDEIYKNIRPEEDITTSKIISNRQINLRNPADYPRV